MINDNTSGDIEMSQEDIEILEAWIGIHGASDDGDATTLAKAKENHIGYFDGSDDYVLHEIEKHGWFDGVNNLISGNVNLESLATELGYRSDSYHGSDNLSGHYFILQTTN